MVGSALVAAAAAAASLATAAALTAAAAADQSSRAAGSLPTVPCFDAIDHLRSGREAGYRVALGVVSAPPARLPGPVQTHDRPWRYWQKAGLLVLMGEPAVTVSVPRAWRRRVAVTWGSAGIVSALRIQHCPPPSTAWSAYAGGFYLRSPACVPLMFTVGRKAATLWFGIGRRCSRRRLGPTG